MKYSEKWGDSVDAAVELALQELKLERDKVKITVLEEPSNGFLGFGAKLAKVRVEEIVEKLESEKPVAADLESEAFVEKKASAESKTENKSKRVSKHKERKESNTYLSTADGKMDISTFGDATELVSARPDDLQEAENHPAKDFLTTVTFDMGIEVSIKVFSNSDCVYVDIDGKDTGTVIGKRGATLDAIQYLTSLVVNKDSEKYIRVVVDAEGYRAKREETLEKLALKLAEKAIKTGRIVKLEPMNPYERKVIHTALQRVPAVTTKSEGAEPYRKVVIVPARNQ